MENSKIIKNMQDLIDLIKKICKSEKQQCKGCWHLGKVVSVINSKLLSVYVDGSSVAQNISCSSDIVYAPDDEIWVVFINGDSKNKFVISKRGV